MVPPVGRGSGQARDQADQGGGRERVSDGEMAGFSYLEHKENVALALEVADRFGVPRTAALAAMYRALPDPGVLRETAIPTEKGRLHFFNALAANDPDSSF